jgi:glycosyltransferase involved in cell wall biosynthesis
LRYKQEKMTLVNSILQQPRIGFVFSTEVGLKTQYLNWRETFARLAPPLSPEWIVIDWYQKDGLLERVPLLPSGVKARLRSQLTLHQGFQGRHFDGLLIGAPAVAYSQRSLLARQPYFAAIDCTPKQLLSMGYFYNKKATQLPAFEHWKERARQDFYQNAERLFPWSHWAAESMIEDYGADPKRVEVVPPGVDLGRWSMPRRSLDGTLHLLFVGGNFVRKGGDMLLEWAHKTRKKNWQLHLVTQDAVPTNHPNIHIYNDLNPNDPALIALYQTAHLFVLPTRADCYSLAGIEAMAAGLPVLLGNVGGTGDIVRDGETGYLLAPNDSDALVERMEFLLSAPEHLLTMGTAARRDAELRFDGEKNVAHILSQMQNSLERLHSATEL